jgi:small subunit ribosomal protein S16
MPTRIRLQRKGKKGQPFYHLVVADGRAPRDGKFIEKLGIYNPMTHPATIELNFDRALYWLQVGAQPSDTARSILSHKGVLLKEHLLRGVKKGALTEDQVEEKFQAWMEEKEAKIAQAGKDLELSEKEQLKQAQERERKINEARAEELAKKRAKDNLKAEEAEETEAPAQEEAAEEAQAPEASADDTPAAEAEDKA